MVFKCSQRRDNFPRKFEKKGSGNGELSRPVSISVDSEGVVCVALRMTTVVFQCSLACEC